MAETAEHKALPTKTIVASVAKVIKSHPMVIGMVIDIMVRRLPITEHNGDDIGALNIAMRGTIEPIYTKSFGIGYGYSEWDMKL